MEPNMIGAYGPWAAGILGEGPARLSFRQARFEAGAIDAWCSRRPAGCRGPSSSTSSFTTGCTSST